MKMSEMLQSCRIMVPSGTDEEEMRKLILKAYKHCWTNGYSQRQRVNTALGPKMSVTEILIPATKVYSDKDIEITYTNFQTCNYSRSVKLQVHRVGAVRHLIALNVVVDLESKVLKVLTYDSGNWEEHLMSL